MCDVSIIIPIYNGKKWINQCFESLLNQTVFDKSGLTLEVVVCDDSSTDETPVILESWRNILHRKGVQCIIVRNQGDCPAGVGAAKNVAVSHSKGTYLCFQDIDDIMLPRRIEMQLDAAKDRKSCIVGCKFRREPVGSTKRFTDWANTIDQDKLNVQIYTSHGPTVIMPTWFCHRTVYDRVGGFREDGKGTPEDLIFFYKHIDLEGSVHRVDEELLIYTYHTEATTFTVLSDTIWNIRINQIEKNVLNKWTQFSVWNAGKQGRKFIRCLTMENKRKITTLCDVDKKKVGKQYSLYCDRTKKFLMSFPIVHFKDVVPPIVICVKLSLTNGEFEANLKSLNVEEGSDYIIFS